MRGIYPQSANQTITSTSYGGLCLLLAIVAIAVVVRLWGVWFGLPYIYHNDEGREVIRALQLGTGSFDLGRLLKGGYFYFLFFEYGIYFAILKLTGVIRSSIEFAYLFIRDPSSFYLIGRVTTALIGAFNVVLLYMMGRRVYSSRVGLLSALFLTLNILHARHSHYVTVDVPMTCLATLSLWYAIQVSLTARLKYTILCAIFTGLAIVTKAPSVVLIIPLLMAHGFSPTGALGTTRFKESSVGTRIIVAVVTLLVVVVAGNPGLILNVKVLLGFAADFLGRAGTSPESAEIVNGGAPINVWVYYLAVLRDSMGLPLLIVSFLGVLYGLVRHTREDTLLIAFLLSYYVLICLHPSLFYDRYAIPLLPVLVLLGVRFLVEMSARVVPQRAALVSTSLAVLVILVPGYEIVREDILISQKDTRTYAKEWIENHIPVGSKILIEGSRTKPYPSTVPLQNSRENIERNIQTYREEDPGKARYFELELKLLSGKTYDLLTVGDHISTPADRWKDVSHYKALGVEYLVLRPRMFEGKSPQLAHFHQSVKQDPQISLIQTFASNRTDRPGPTIEIYHIEKGMD
jgi:4-amino-4-deoxy-L-arabinose transferase-like glycosyltransferase